MVGTMMMMVVLVMLMMVMRVGSQEDTFPRTQVISTRKGKVQGRRLNLVGGEYHLDEVEVYLGIPYALPPTGIWRFSPTQDLPPWPGILQATAQGPACPQTFPRMDNQTEALQHFTAGYLEYMKNVRSSTLAMSEDCLYLNVFAPSAEGRKADNPYAKGLAVMVFIQGDSYSWGSAATYDARVLAALGKIIVVTFNYRIGILGYLNANPSPGRRGSVSNYGLVDQMAALQWVNENIGAFGGDPELVTLVGSGHGAASVELLVHSPMIRQSHFQRVVLMSGSMFSTWARVHKPSEVAVSIARQLGCPIPADLQTHHANILHCLRSKTIEELLSVDLGPHLAFLSSMGPSNDGVTIKNNFVDIRGKRSFETRSYDAIVGLTEYDWVHQLGEDNLVNGVSPEQRESILRSLVLNNYDSHHKEIFLAVTNEYSDFKKGSVDRRRERNLTLSAVSDALFGAPAIHSAGTFARRRNNTYFYSWEHATRNGLYPQGVGSWGGGELDYLFGIPICNVWQHQDFKYTRGEAILSAMAITYFSNFVKTGDPNIPCAVEDLIRTQNGAKRNKMVHWDKYSEDRRQFISIDVKPEMKENYKSHEMSLWLRLVPQLEATGSNNIMGHGQLVGETWGLVRNHTSSPGVQQMSLGDVAACKEQNQTSQYSKLVALGTVLGSVLVAINSLIIFCVCYKKQNNRSSWEREGRGIGSTECLNNSLIETQSVPSFSTPGRTATLRRQSDRQAVPLSNYQYKDSTALYTESTAEYKPCTSGVPLIADIPAPRQFNDQQHHSESHFRQDVITC